MMPETLCNWICEELLHTPQTLNKGMLKSFAQALMQAKVHLERLGMRGRLHPYALHSSNFPVLRPYRFPGIVHCLSMTYRPYIAGSQTGDKDALALEEVLEWVYESACETMQVNLYETAGMRALMQLQRERLFTLQTEILGAIADGMVDELTRAASIRPLDFILPSFIRKNRIDMKSVYYTSYEVFMHHSDEEKNRDNIAFIADAILRQLDADYARHGLNITKHQLGALLRIVRDRLMNRIRHSDVQIDAWFSTPLGRKMLSRYITDDMLHRMVSSYRMLELEKAQRRAWMEQLGENRLPPRLHARVVKSLMLFHEMYIVTMDDLEGNLKGLRLCYRELGYTYDGFLSCFVRLLLDAGGNVKQVIKAYERFALLPGYLERYPLENGQNYYTLNMKLMHDFYEVLHPAICRFFFALRRDCDDAAMRKKLANTILGAMVSHNMHSCDAVNHLAAQLGLLMQSLNDRSLLHENVVRRLTQSSSLATLLGLCADVQFDLKQHRSSHLLNYINTVALCESPLAEYERYELQQKHLRMAAAMGVQEQYVSLYEKASRGAPKTAFFTPAQEQWVSLANTAHYTLGVYEHNHPIGVLGAGVRGVCIRLNSAHRLEQLNASFMNLCIHDDEKVMLWGLLCRAYNVDEKVYILNNLQGSLNSRHLNPYTVRKEIIALLLEFKERNGLDAILIRSQSFNAIDIADGLSKADILAKRYVLEKSTRLDFEYTEAGMVVDKGFYIL